MSYNKAWSGVLVSHCHATRVNRSNEQNKSPGVVNNVLNYLVQNFLKESRPDPDVFDGLGREGLRGAAGGKGALSPQWFMAHTLGSPVGHRALYY